MATYNINVHKNTQTGYYNGTPAITIKLVTGTATRSNATVTLPITVTLNKLGSSSSFGYDFTIYASIGSGSRVQLFNKGTSPSTWSAQTTTANLTASVTGTTTTLYVYFYSQYCPCTGHGSVQVVWSQSGISVPAYQYTVKFYKNGGTWASSGSDPQSVTVNSGSSASAPLSISRSGYTFKNWNTAQGGGGTSYSGSITNVSSNMSVYAQWTAVTYTVTYNTNGGTGGPSSPVTVNAGSYTISSTKPTGKTFTVTFDANGGTASETSRQVTQTFKSWNTAANGSGTSYSAGKSITISSNLTLYAQYTNPTIGTLPTAERYNEITEENDTVFGWSTSSMGGNYVSADTEVSDNMIIYAQYGIYITYYYNTAAFDYKSDTGSTTDPDEDDGDDPEFGDDLGIFATEEKSYGVNYTIMSDVPIVPQKQFINWNTDKDGNGTTYVGGDIYTKDESMDLYGQYDPGKYTVTFDANGGKFADGSTKKVYTDVEFGTGVEPPDNPTRSQHSFVGWLGNYWEVTQDTTIKAMWNYYPIWIQNSQHEWEGFR